MRMSRPLHSYIACVAGEIPLLPIPLASVPLSSFSLLVKTRAEKTSAPLKQSPCARNAASYARWLLREKFQETLLNVTPPDNTLTNVLALLQSRRKFENLIWWQLLW